MRKKNKSPLRQASYTTAGIIPCQSPPAHHPCTTQWWALAGPRPYSSKWWALLRDNDIGRVLTILGKSSWRRDPTKRDKMKTSFNISLSIAFVSLGFTWMKLNNSIVQNALTTILFMFQSFVLYASRKSPQGPCGTRPWNVN